ncbi:serine palmitoyltransferase [Raphidocelis subcapitata]|uniref:serine C-palmitoyltransferase n=1 Tax=Raphidocelis subcapitata TaxID=307507 RepID=A0A2V0NQ01_9CHLO|nr:serine palmitoyltransferase [Raphidocelis subcapitata]|eukprot:GBF89694.1 serine palmitoyltransferase [Raphidocelis subcapitata]
MRRLTRKACLLAALGLCAVAWSKAAEGPLRRALSFSSLATSLRDVDAGKIIQALQEMRLRPIRQAWAEFWDIFGPGGRLHPDWFIEHQGHLFIEGGLMAIILVLFFQSGYRPSKEQEEEPLTEREIDELCREWKPEPLVPDIAEEDQLPEPPVIQEWENSHWVTVAGRRALNLTAADFLGLSNDPSVAAAARATVERYGVGSCGPRGFYGTFDVHLQLEQDLAAFMGEEEAIIYSYDIATVASVIPAFASRADILVMDEGCSYPIQQGAKLSRARVFTFKHNDAGDLAALLGRIEAEEARERKPLCRRMIVVEGVYSNTGEVAPLRRIYELKERYKYRLCVEETLSFGVMGERGRGACEAAGLEPGQVEIICASMSGALGSVGGFCVGHSEVCDHQRLCGQGYCFSASLPPYLATAAIAALRILGTPDGQALARRVRGAAAELRAALAAGPPGLVLAGAADGPAAASPVVHLHLDPSVESRLGPRPAVAAALQRVADILLQRYGVFVALPRYSVLDEVHPRQSIKLVANAALASEGRVEHVASALREAAAEVLGGSDGGSDGGGAA